jgi:hypothetical protein
MDYTGAGITVAALTIAVGLVEILKHFVLKKTNGVVPLACPNKIEGLAEAMLGVKESTKRTSDVVKHIGEGVDDLVDDHKAVSGVQPWKFQKRHEDLWEQSVNQQQEIASVLSRFTTATERMVELQQETISILKHNGGQ